MKRKNKFPKPHKPRVILNPICKPRHCTVERIREAVRRAITKYKN